MGAVLPPPTPKLRAEFEAAGGKPSYVRGMFGRIAHVYDLMNRVMTIGLDRHWRTFAAEKVALEAGQSALDIGTGTGDLAFTLLRLSAPDAHVVGVDFTPEMLEIGRAKAARMGLSDRVEFRLGDGERLGFEDETFDAVCSAFVVRNLADLHAGFSEMLRVVKPGGRVACLEISHPYLPIFATAFHLYFDRLVPLLGKMIGRSFDAYSYLPSSVTVFPDAPHLKAILQDAGWAEVHYYYLLGGAVAVHTGVRPS